MSLMFALITNRKSGLFSSFEFCTARSGIDKTFLCARRILSCLSQTSHTQVERQLSTTCSCLHQSPRCKVDQMQALLRLPREVMHSTTLFWGQHAACNTNINWLVAGVCAVSKSSSGVGGCGIRRAWSWPWAQQKERCFLQRHAHPQTVPLQIYGPLVRGIWAYPCAQ